MSSEQLQRCSVAVSGLDPERFRATCLGHILRVSQHFDQLASAAARFPPASLEQFISIHSFPRLALSTVAPHTPLPLSLPVSARYCDVARSWQGPPAANTTSRPLTLPPPTATVLTLQRLQLQRNSTTQNQRTGTLPTHQPHSTHPTPPHPPHLTSPHRPPSLICLSVSRQSFRTRRVAVVTVVPVGSVPVGRTTTSDDRTQPLPPPAVRHRGGEGRQGEGESRVEVEETRAEDDGG